MCQKIAPTAEVVRAESCRARHSYSAKNTMQGQMFLDKELVCQALRMEVLCAHYDIEVLNNYQCRCPFHGEDKKPSATIRSNFFYCFTCGERHDPLGLIMAMEGCNFVQALRRGAAFLGMTPSVTHSEFAHSLAKRKHDHSENERILLASEEKYRILAMFARTHRQYSLSWLPKLDYLLDAWLYAVPLWVSLFSLLWAFGNPYEMEKAISRLYQENEVYYG